MSAVVPSKVNGQNTVSQFVSALVSSGGTLLIEVLVFFILRIKLGRIYSPRTYLPPPDKRSKELPNGPWKWLPAVIMAPPKEILEKNGLDAYMFLRFLKLVMRIFLLFTVISIPVLFPVDFLGVHPTEPQTGLNRFTWTNVAGDPNASDRFAAHILLVYIFTFFVLYLIRRELLHFTHMRHQFLISAAHSHLAQARTVLITAVPDELANERDLRLFCSFVPGGVDRVWIFRDTKTLDKLYERRVKACKKLETAESKILRQATKAWHRKEEMERKAVRMRGNGTNGTNGKKGGKDGGAGSMRMRERERPMDEESRGQDIAANGDTLNPSPSEDDHENPRPRITSATSATSQNSSTSRLETSDGEGNLIPPAPSHAFLDELVPVGERPRHRLGAFGWAGVGEKVDTVDWCKNEIATLNKQIDEAREHIVKGRFMGSVFIRCKLQMGAHVLAQCVSYHEPLKMYDKWLEAHPKDIVWSNLHDGAFEARARWVASWGATLGLIVLGALFSTFVGTLSSLSALSGIPGLKWINHLSGKVQGIITGIIPPLLLSILFAIMPFILKFLAWFERIPRYSLIDVEVYRRYFLFLLFNGFLIVTITSGLAKVIANIVNNPTTTVEQLADQLPAASVFFLTYMVTQGFAGAGSALIQLFTLILYFIRKWFLGRTPRQAYGVTFQMPSVNFGFTLPRLSLLASIAFAYSVLNPLINALALVAFVLYYIAWKFLLMQVFDQPDQSETGGLYFPMAISNLFIGLYIEQFCLAALFFLSSKSGPKFIVYGALMVVLLVLTYATSTVIHKSFDPITDYLPMSLATKKMANRYERRRRQGRGGLEGLEQEFDLFNTDRITNVRRRIQAIPQKIQQDIMPKALGGTSKPAEQSEKGGMTHGEHARATGRESPEAVDGNGIPDFFRHLSDLSDVIANDADEDTIETGNTEPVHDEGNMTETQNGAYSSKETSQAAAPSAGNSLPTIKTKDHAPPPRRNNTLNDSDDDDDLDDEDGYDEHAFDHPSTYVQQRWIWLPKDKLGLSEMLVADLRNAGVEASDLGAVMDEKGIVEVDRNPPDQEWNGGQDL